MRAQQEAKNLPCIFWRSSEPVSLGRRLPGRARNLVNVSEAIPERHSHTEVQTLLINAQGACEGRDEGKAK